MLSKKVRRNILITGGAGFIGSHLVKQLLDEEVWNVSVIDNFDDFYAPEIKHRNIARFKTYPNFKLYRGDIRNCRDLREIFEENKFSAIVHLAAKAGVRPSMAKAIEYNETNVGGTLNLLEHAKEFNVGQFVFGSSSSVYGSRREVPFNENDKTDDPISPYAATKKAGELLCHTYSHLYQIRTICLRFFTVYGAFQRPDLAIHKFTKLISDNKPIPVFGDGSSRRDYTYVDDILQGIRAAIDFDGSLYEVINLGESDTVELHKLISLLEKSLGKKAIIDRHPMQAGDVPRTFADISKAKELLNYDPQTKIEDGIEKFVEWFKNDNRDSLRS